MPLSLYYIKIMRMAFIPGAHRTQQHLDSINTYKYPLYMIQFFLLSSKRLTNTCTVTMI